MELYSVTIHSQAHYITRELSCILLLNVKCGIENLRFVWLEVYRRTVDLWVLFLAPSCSYGA
jgi:hypothetical protein